MYLKGGGAPYNHPNHHPFPIQAHANMQQQQHHNEIYPQFTYPSQHQRPPPPPLFQQPQTQLQKPLQDQAFDVDNSHKLAASTNKMTSSTTPAPVVNFAEIKAGYQANPSNSSSSSEHSSNNLVDLTGENSQFNFDNQDLLKDFQNFENSGDDTSTNDELYDEDDS
jgi:hypothetical protein